MESRVVDPRISREGAASGADPSRSAEDGLRSRQRRGGRERSSVRQRDGIGDVIHRERARRRPGLGSELRPREAPASCRRVTDVGASNGSNRDTRRAPPVRTDCSWLIPNLTREQPHVGFPHASPITYQGITPGDEGKAVCRPHRTLGGLFVSRGPWGSICEAHHAAVDAGGRGGVARRRLGHDPICTGAAGDWRFRRGHAN